MTPEDKDLELLKTAASHASEQLTVEAWYDDLSFVRIYKILSSLCGGDIEFMRYWIHTSNIHLNGRFPVDLIQSKHGITCVADYLLSFSK